MPNISERNRREFLATSAAMLVAGPAGIAAVARAATGATTESPRPLSFGMVTYLWGRDFSLPELLVACEASGLEGLELRTTHRHGVERDLGAEERREIRKRFADSPVANRRPKSDSPIRIINSNTSNFDIGARMRPNLKS